MCKKLCRVLFIVWLKMGRVKKIMDSDLFMDANGRIRYRKPTKCRNSVSRKVPEKALYIDENGNVRHVKYEKLFSVYVKHPREVNSDRDNYNVCCTTSIVQCNCIIKYEKGSF